jgi:hypothetical protein
MRLFFLISPSVSVNCSRNDFFINNAMHSIGIEKKQTKTESKCTIPRWGKWFKKSKIASLFNFRASMHPGTKPANKRKLK